MKSGDKRRVATLRLLLASLKNEKIQAQRELTDEEVESVLRRAVKQRRDSIEQYDARRPAGPVRRRDRGVRDPRGVPAQGPFGRGGRGRDPRHHRGERPPLREGRGSGHEGSHGASSRPRRRQEGPGDRAPSPAVSRAARIRRLARRSRSSSPARTSAPCARASDFQGRGCTRRCTTRVNDLYDDAAAAGSRRSGRTVRLRRAAGRAILTYKGRARFQNGVKTREEREVDVSDGGEAEGILGGPGPLRRFRYEKRREEWELRRLRRRPGRDADRRLRGGRGRSHGHPAGLRPARARLHGGDSLFLRRAVPAPAKGGSRASPRHGLGRRRA